MKRMLLLTLLTLAMTTVAVAQSNTPPPPPDVMLIIREDIKPGKLPAHEQEAMHFVHTQAKANGRLPAEMRDTRLAMTPIAGNTNEVMYLHPYRSFADMEAKNKEIEKLTAGVMKADFESLPDAELHAAQIQMIGRYRPDLSTNIGAVEVAQARYMMVTTLRLKPGTEDDYWEKVKKVMWPAREKAGDKSSVAVYSVGAGAPATTYVMIRPMKSLAELDTPMNRVRNAMGDGRDELDKARDKSVLFFNSALYAFNPRLSIVGEEFAARDTTAKGFWITKPQMPGQMTTATRVPASKRRER